jgi:hypothetical protein
VSFVTCTGSADRGTIARLGLHPKIVVHFRTPCAQTGNMASAGCPRSGAPDFGVRRDRCARHDGNNDGNQPASRSDMVSARRASFMTGRQPPPKETERPPSGIVWARVDLRDAREHVKGFAHSRGAADRQDKSGVFRDVGWDIPNRWKCVCHHLPHLARPEWRKPSQRR